MQLLLLTLFLLALASVQGSCIDSYTQYGYNFIPYENASECIHSFPLSTVVKSTTIDNVRRMMHSYAFLDEAKNGNVGDFGAHFPLHVDVLSELNEIEKTTHQDDYSFHTAMSHLFNRLQDAHTVYTRPRPYQRFLFGLPFRIVPQSVNGKHVLIIHESPISETLHYYYQLFYGDYYTPNKMSIQNWILTEIDHQDSIQHIRDWAVATDFFCRDDGGKFNHATLAEDGGWTLRSLSVFDIPEKDRYLLKMTSPNGSQSIEFEMRWMAIYLRYPGLTDASISTSTSATDNNNNNNDNNDRMMMPDPVDRIFASPEFQLKAKLIRQKQQQPSLFSSSLLSSTLSEGLSLSLSPIEQWKRIHALGSEAFFGISGRELAEKNRIEMTKRTRAHIADIMNNNNNNNNKNNENSNACNSVSYSSEVNFEYVSSTTMALVISTFSPAANESNYIHAIECAVQQHIALGGTRLILDLRGNGGGKIALFYGLIRFLFPNHNFVASHSIDVRMSEFFRQLLTASARKVNMDPTIYPSDYLSFLSPMGLISYNTSASPSAAAPNMMDRNRFYDERWIDGPFYMRGSNQPQQYSHRFAFNFESELAAWTTSTKGYEPQNVIVLTDGLSASSAAMFSSYVQAHRLGRIISMGGLLTEPFPMQGWTVPGGSIWNIGTFSLFGWLGGVNESLVPNSLPNYASVSAVWAQMYDWLNHSVVAEYAYHAPDQQLLYTVDPNNASLVYKTQIEPQFDHCVDGLTEMCHISHGEGHIECDPHTHLTTDKCIASICDAGYYGPSCSPCPVGFYRMAFSPILACSPCTNARFISHEYTVNYTSSAVPTADCPFIINSTMPTPSPSSSSTSEFPVNGKTVGSMIGMFAGGVIITLVIVWALFFRAGARKTNVMDVALLDAASATSTTTTTRV
eukprot:TRINITY_DN2308_c0_g1_i1.p1 TRINITY_DN2308_c0_g1~~TRINITY_DN2308_c0_g1_i1.p1  ORF type:complete len:909 (-),score=234.45 TRINITY_DN2308_c0_g1_i1:147-2873(-)